MSDAQTKQLERRVEALEKELREVRHLLSELSDALASEDFQAAAYVLQSSDPQQ